MLSINGSLLTKRKIPQNTNPFPIKKKINKYILICSKNAAQDNEEQLCSSMVQGSSG